MNTQKNAQVLQVAKAWNWKWPMSRNRWDTKLSPKRADPRTRYTSMGPSNRTVTRRAARVRRGDR